MNTCRGRAFSRGTLQRVLMVLMMVLVALPLLPGPVAGGADVAPSAGAASAPLRAAPVGVGPAKELPPCHGIAPLSAGPLPPGATATWWDTVQRDIAQDLGQVRQDILSLSPSLGWHGLGEGENDHFGYAVGTAGDVNGDGFADVIVGAYGHPDESMQGCVYVYHGSAAGLSSTAVWTATGEIDNTWFGYAVGTAGDVNGDGYADVIVGAPGTSGGEFRGTVYLYHGSAAGLSSAPAWTVSGEGNLDQLGCSVGTAGDVNGDGFDDVIAGAPGFPDGGFQGQAYVYHGSAAGLSVTPAWTATGESALDHLGYAVAAAGDINGDGYGDVVVGAYGYPGGSRQGQVHVYHGSAAGLSSTPAWTSAGESNEERFGWSVATAGDVNGDGYADVVAASPGYPGGNCQGKVYVYHGSAVGLPASADWTVVGENSWDFFGWSAATAGDVNGDGYADVIVGAFAYPELGEYGKAYVYHGSSIGLRLNTSWTTRGENAQDWYGYPVGTAGDVDGDDFSDGVIGAHGFGPRATVGKAYVYYGQADDPACPSMHNLFGSRFSASISDSYSYNDLPMTRIYVHVTYLYGYGSGGEISARNHDTGQWEELAQAYQGLVIERYDNPPIYDAVSIYIWGSGGMAAGAAYEAEFVICAQYPRVYLPMVVKG